MANQLPEKACRQSLRTNFVLFNPQSLTLLWRVLGFGEFKRQPQKLSDALNFGRVVGVLPSKSKVTWRLTVFEPSGSAPCQGKFRRRIDTMKKFITKVQKFMQAEDGPTAVEYAIMLALIVIVCLAAIQAVGTAANGAFQNVSTEMTAAGIGN